MIGRLAVLRRALWTLFEDSGFSMAGAVAFSFTLSLFPFCIFLGALGRARSEAEISPPMPYRSSSTPCPIRLP